MTKERNHGTFRSIKRFFRPIMTDPKWAILSSIISILLAGCNIFLIVCLQFLTKSIQEGDYNSFVYWIIILGGCFFILILGSFIGKFVTNRLIISICDIQDVYYPRKIMELENTFLEKQGTGRIASVWRKGTVFWIDMLVGVFGDYMTTIFVVLGSIIFLIQKGFSGMWLVLGILVSLIWVFLFHKRSYKRRKVGKQIVTELDRQGIRIVMSKMEILQNNRIETEIRKRLAMNVERLHGKDKEKFWQGLCYDGVNLFLYAGLFIITFLVGFISLKDTKNIPQFVLVTGLGLGVIKQLSNITAITKKIFDDSIHLEHLRTIFDKGNNTMNIHSGKEFSYKHGNINITNISFSYDKNPVLQSFSLHIKGGTKTAFVGESGGGKTTLIKLLAGYIRPDSGDIEIDNQKLSEIKLTDYYKHIGHLTQDPSVFDGTIYENLVYALDTEPKKEELEKIIKHAKCEFIRDFDKGLETEIGERGVRLSGGQKQRLAIAKIMLKKPNIILLDEPTSALDSFNEEQISIALHNLFKGKTVIVVAHRLQTVKQADRICYIEQGKIIEEGTHDELVKFGGRYKKMLDLQSGF